MTRFSFLSLLLISACTAPKYSQTRNSPGSLAIDGKIYATAYMQKAAEYKALCFQAYNFARLRLDELLRTTDARPRAIITDIDETVLDNSAYEVHQTPRNMDYDQAAWYGWTARAEADTVPGAPSFLKYAASKGVEVFYITNRDEKERAATMQNLQRFGLPNTDNAHLMPRVSTSGKEARRQEVMAHYNVLLLLGDNLADFTASFDRKTTDERSLNVQALAGEFGNRFIVLPNPVYGDWESALYNYNYKLSPAQKDSAIRAALRKTY